MEKGQAVSIVKRLAAYYPGWKIDEETVGFWIEALLEENYEFVVGNVRRYIKKNEYPPSIASLLKEDTTVSYQKHVMKLQEEMRDQNEYSD